MRSGNKPPRTGTDFTKRKGRGMAKATKVRMQVVVTVLVAVLMATSAGSATGQTAPPRPDRGGAGRPPHDSAPHPYQPHLRIGVAGMDTRRVVEVRDGVVPVVVVNQRDEPVIFDLAVDAQADGVNTRITQREQALAPSGTSRFLVSLDSLGIAPERLRGPAVLTLRATTHDAAGNPIDGVVNPSLYLSKDPNIGVVLYDEKRLQQNYNGGRISGVGSVDGSPRTINLFAGPATGDFDPEADLPLAAPGLHTICVKWQYASGDHYAGERYYATGEPMAARGVKLRVIQGGVSKTVYANKNTGCTSLPLVGGKLTKVLVFSEAKIGTNDNIKVRAYEQAEDATDDVPKTQENLKKWSYYLLPGSGTSHLSIPAGTSSTLMAYGSFSAWRLDQEAPLTQPELIIDLQHEPKSTNSGAGSQTLHIAATQYDRRFVYGHEVGHWFAKKNGLGYSLNFDKRSNLLECTSDDEPNELLHIMRSTEVNSAAFGEGLAHFLSTVVWNGFGWHQPMFRYYKDLFDEERYGVLAQAYADYEQNYNQIDMVASSDISVGGERNWRDNVCGIDDTAQYSVELDWARFLVNYLEGDRWWGEWGGPEPTFAQLLDLLQYAEEHYIAPARAESSTQASYDIYWHFLDALGDPGLGQQQFVDRFEHYAMLYGVELEE